MYPMLKEDVYMRISKSKKSDKLHYLVVNGDDEEFEVSPKLYNALLEADGTKPLNLPDEGKRVIHKVKYSPPIEAGASFNPPNLAKDFILQASVSEAMGFL